MKPENLFVLYEDDSVEIQYSDGSHLQLSPCGSEFFFEKALPASAHPLQQTERIRQRTQFAISSYKDQVLQALEFRNRFSVCPYLPSSTIPSERIISLLTNISDAKWPSMIDGHVKSVDNGSVKVSSLDGHAHLYLTKLQQEFTVEFLCKVSKKFTSPTLKLQDSGKCTRSKSNKPCYNASSNLEEMSKRLTAKDTTEHEFYCNTVGEVNKKDRLYPVEGMALSPESFTKFATQYTWVVQQCSVSSCPEEWRYPLSLAIKYYNLQIVNKTELTEESKMLDSPALEEDGQERMISVLPKALQLTCDAPHLHRWGFFDLISQRKQDDVKYLRPGLINVVWCKGILYRFIHGSMNSVEIYPGDGSFFISRGASIRKYFTHCSVHEASEKKEERMYAVTNLPPDKPECQYSVCDIITKAIRSLEHCYKTELSLSYGCEICCWKMVSPADKTAAQPVILKQAVIQNIGRFSAYSNNRVIADFFDGLTLHMIWNCTSYHRGTQNLDNADLSSTSQIHDDSTGWCQLFFPDGGHQLIQVEFPEPFESYVKPVIAWCRMLNVNCEKEIPGSNIEEDCRSVIAELDKLQRFNFLLENSNVPRNTSDLKVIQHSNIDTRTLLGDDASLPDDIGEKSILDVLEKTSKAIKDIDFLLSSSSRK